MNSQSKEAEKKVENRTKEKESDDSVLTSNIFNFLIVLTIVGTGLIIRTFNQLKQQLLDLKHPAYKFPCLEDFSISLICAAILMVIKILTEKISMPIVNLIVLNKYNDPKDEANYELGKIYKKKLATNFFKIFYYSFISIFGYLTLNQLEYFPVSLGGNGALKNMFSQGYPDSFFHTKPEYFDYYYMTGLGFNITDIIWLIFIYELQTDFKMMLLHHLCTISLITFSYLSNYSNIGCVILFLHDFGDIFVYLTRIVINTEVKSFFKIGSGVLLVIVLLYTRIYVLGELICTVWYYISWEWNAVEYCLFTFVCFLYMLHINWVYLIFRKLYIGMKENKIEDTSHVKKISTSQ